MLHLINRENRSRYVDLLESHYRLRHRVYVYERGWKALDRPDGREIDQFDNDDATYLIWARGTEVLGAARFVPTDKPHLMSDIFPHTATLAPVPRRSSVWEITRFFSVRDPAGAVSRNTVIGDILCAMFEMGLHHDLEAISVVCDTFFLPRFLEQNIKAVPLGLPTPYPEGVCIACMLPVDHEQLSAARSARGVTNAVLFPVAGLDPRMPPRVEVPAHAAE